MREVITSCLKAQMYPLIIGNIQYSTFRPGQYWKPNLVNTVVTRQQKQMECKKTKPIYVSKIIGSDVPRDDTLRR